MLPPAVHWRLLVALVDKFAALFGVDILVGIFHVPVFGYQEVTQNKSTAPISQPL